MSTKNKVVQLTQKQINAILLSLKASALYRSTERERSYLVKLTKKIEEQTNA